LKIEELQPFRAVEDTIMFCVPWLFVALLCQADFTPPDSVRPIQLERFASEVTEGLSHRVSSEYGNESARRRYREYLTLASAWPHSSFCVPLLDILNHGEAFDAALAAEGLLNYEDENLRDRVATFVDDQRSAGPRSMQLYLGPMIKQRLEKRPLPSPFERPDEGLSFKTVLVEDGPWFMTALRAVQHDELRVRFAAFVWLARHGVVVDTGPLRATWPMLTSGERPKVLGCMTDVLFGAADLRLELEALLANQGDVPLGDGKQRRARGGTGDNLHSHIDGGAGPNGFCPLQGRCATCRSISRSWNQRTTS
jgi:hypothetical protein